MNGIPNGWTENDVKAVEYIELYGYTNTTGGSPDYEFTEPVLVKVSDCFNWNDITE